MKINRIAATLLAILFGALIFFTQTYYNQTAPAGFAPIDVLYHGSTDSNILFLEPRNIYFRDENEGAVVFATPSLKLASCFFI